MEDTSLLDDGKHGDILQQALRGVNLSFPEYEDTGDIMPEQDNFAVSLGSDRPHEQIFYKKSKDSENLHPSSMEQPQPLSEEEMEQLLNQLTKPVVCPSFDWNMQPAQIELTQNQHTQLHASSMVNAVQTENINQIQQNFMESNNQSQTQNEINNMLYVQQSTVIEERNTVVNAQSNQTNGLSQIQSTPKSMENCKGNISRNVNEIIESKTREILPRCQFILPHQSIVPRAQAVNIPAQNSQLVSCVSTVPSSQNTLFLQGTSLNNGLFYAVSVPQIANRNNASSQVKSNVRLCTKTNNTNANNTNTLNNNGVLFKLVPSTTNKKSPQVPIKLNGSKQQYIVTPSTSTDVAAIKSNSLLNKNVKQKSNASVPITPIQNSSQKKSVHKSSPIGLKNLNACIITTPNTKTNNGKVSTAVSVLKNNNAVKQNFSNTILIPLEACSETKLVQVSRPQKSLVSPQLQQNTVIVNVDKKVIPQKQNITSQDPSNPNKHLSSCDKSINVIQPQQICKTFVKLSSTEFKEIKVLVNENPNSKLKTSNSPLTNRIIKRGRPKKIVAKPPVLVNKPAVEEITDEQKDDRKKVIARTRSGRLSRPPRHMIRDYKHLSNSESLQYDLDDSDGGYSDYITSGCIGMAKLEEEAINQNTELLTGLEMPKRKISPQFRCPTCCKVYLGKLRMANHFQVHPDHGSMDTDQLPPPTIESELKQVSLQDLLKPKGKKRGPWANTPEAKSERRQQKLNLAISECENSEIIKVAAERVVNLLSLEDFMRLKLKKNPLTFLAESNEFMERLYKKLNMADDENRLNKTMVNLNEELLRNLLYVEEPKTEARHFNDSLKVECDLEPSLKRQKIDGILEEGRENLSSSGFSRSPELSPELLKEGNDKLDCPEVLSALTLMPTNHSVKAITNPELNSKNNQGYQNISINISESTNSGFIKEGTFTRLGDSIESNYNNACTQINDNYDKPEIESQQPAFIRLEPSNGILTLENGKVAAINNSENMNHFGNMQTNGFNYTSDGSTDTFNSTKSFKNFGSNTEITTTSRIDVQQACSDDELNNHTEEHPDKIMNTQEEIAQFFQNNAKLQRLMDERLNNVSSSHIIVTENILDGDNLLESNVNLQNVIGFEAFGEEFNINARS